MNEFSLRVDLSIPCESVVEALLPYVIKYAYCIENPISNPHMHWYLVTDYTGASIRSVMRKLGLKGNGSYSLTKVKDPVKYLAYIMKQGEFKIVGLPDELVNEAKEYDEKVKSDKVKKKNKFEDIVQYVNERFNIDRYDGISEQRKAIFLLIFDYELENGSKINRNILKLYTDTILSNIRPAYKYDLYSEIYK